MEHVKKVLKYQFWILVGVAFLLPTIGWAMVIGSLSAETGKREGQLKGQFSQIQKLGTGAQPNEGWEQAVTSLKNELKKRVDVTWEDLYAQQEPELTWHPDVAAEAERQGWDHNQVRSLYRDRYLHEIDATARLAEPAKMQFNLLRLAQDQWGGEPPTAEQMREAQEDIWVERSVLKVVRATNEPAETVDMAAIKSIEYLAIADKVADPRPVTIKGGMATAARTTGEKPGRYIDQTDQYKLVRFSLVVTMDHRRIPNLLGNFGSSPVPIEVTQLSMVPASSLGAGAAMGMDPTLATVEVYGNVFLFNPPPSYQRKVAGAAGPADQAGGGTGSGQ